jgi:hypothetical protein
MEATREYLDEPAELDEPVTVYVQRSSDESDDPWEGLFARVRKPDGTWVTLNGFLPQYRQQLEAGENLPKLPNTYQRTTGTDGIERWAIVPLGAFKVTLSGYGTKPRKANGEVYENPYWTLAAGYRIEAASLKAEKKISLNSFEAETVSSSEASEAVERELETM